MAFRLSSDLHIEELDGEILVLVPGREDVLHLRGDQVEAFVLARTGTSQVPEDLTRPMAGLVELGIVETDSWSRRRILQLGGAAAAAAVAVVALPSVAAAESPTTTPPTTLPKPDHLDIEYLIVAGGGAGGFNGGGGGAGGVLRGSTTFDTDTAYQVTVGPGGKYTGNGAFDGGDSEILSVATAHGGGKGGGSKQAGNGGSGGGEGGASNGPGDGTSGQGYRGGNKLKPLASTGSGGGGGAGQVGGDGSATPAPITGGKGGDGLHYHLAEAVNIGTSEGSTSGWVGGGGGGWAFTADPGDAHGGNGGKGGGGHGYGAGTGGGTRGTTNTGGGGGGGGFKGGSGVVIIAYDTTDAAGLTVSGGDRTETPGDGKTYHVFTTTETTNLTFA